MNTQQAQNYFRDRTVLDVELLPSGLYLILCKFGNQFGVWEWDGASSQGTHGEYFQSIRNAIGYFDNVVREEETPLLADEYEDEEDEEF